jgi:predicted amidohydrolase
MNPKSRSKRMLRASSIRKCSTVSFTLAVLVVVLAGGRIAGAEGGGTLRLATCQFPVSADARANGEWVRTQMRKASAEKADLVHFSECALSGYAGVDIPSVDDLDWDALHHETGSILALARELKLWVVLGSTHRLSGGHKPHNCLYVISPEGTIVDRYDKRFCTTGDLRHYAPGDHFVTFEVRGVRCGLLVCYDIRFPELYREYSKLGVRLMLHSFYNARQKEGSIHPKIMPVTARAYAGVNNMFVSINNSSAPRSWPSRFITPDGLVEARLPTDEPGVMVNVVDIHKRYYDASSPFRSDAIHGKLNSGEVVDDPRSKDRSAY